MFEFILDACIEIFRSIRKKNNEKETRFDTRIVAVFTSWKHMLFHVVHVGGIIVFVGSTHTLFEAGCEFASCFVTGPVSLLSLPFVIAYVITSFVRWDYWKVVAICIITEGVSILLAGLYGGAYLWEYIKLQSPHLE